MSAAAAEDVLSTRSESVDPTIPLGILSAAGLGHTPLGSGCEHVGSGSRGRAEQKFGKQQIQGFVRAFLATCG